MAIYLKKKYFGRKRTVQLDDFVQVGEYVLDVSRGQYVFSGEFLVEDTV